MLGKAVLETVAHLGALCLHHIAAGLLHPDVAIGGHDPVFQIVGDARRDQDVSPVGEFDPAGRHRDAGACVIGDAIGDDVDPRAFGAAA